MGQMEREMNREVVRERELKSKWNHKGQINQRQKMSEGQTQIRRETKQKMTSSHEGWSQKAKQCLP